MSKFFYAGADSRHYDYLKKPTTIRGRVYPSRTAAAEAMGVTPRSLGNAIRQGKLDKVGLGHSTHRQSCIFRGKIYLSINAAMRNTGASFYTVKKYMETL